MYYVFMDVNIKYVVDQLALGKSAEEVKVALRTNGWKDDQIDELFARLPQDPSQSFSLENSTAGKPKVAHKTKLLLIVAAFVILVAVGVMALLYFNKISPKTVETTSEKIVTTSIYSGTGYSFEYPSTWKPRKICEILENCSSTSTSEQILFMDEYQIQSSNKAISDYKAGNETDLISLLNLLLENEHQLSVNFTSSSSTPECSSNVSVIDENGNDMCATGYKPISTSEANTAALSSTKTVCQGENNNYSTSNPVRPELIETITVAGKTAYGVKVESNCSSGSYNVYIDVTGGYVNIVLKATSLESISKNEKIVLDTFQVQ